MRLLPQISVYKTEHRNQKVLSLKMEYNPSFNTLMKQNGLRWSQTKKVWYIQNSFENLDKLFHIFKGKAWLELSWKSQKEKPVKAPPLPKQKKTTQLKQTRVILPNGYKETLVRKRYSQSTINTYTSMFKEFLAFFNGVDPTTLDDKDIRAYQDYLVTKKKVAISTQNQAINAIKFYYEKVLGGKRKTYFIERPLKEKKLPNILSSDQIKLMLNAT